MAITVDQAVLGTPVAQNPAVTTVVLTTNVTVAAGAKIMVACSCDPTATVSSVASSPSLTFSLVGASALLLDTTAAAQVQATTAWVTNNLVTSAATFAVAAAETDIATTNTITSPSVETADFQEAGVGNTLVQAYRDCTSGAGTFTIAGTWGSATNGLQRSRA